MSSHEPPTCGPAQSTANADAGGQPRELFSVLYRDLHRIAARELRRNAALTLSPTTLLHETYVRLSPQASAAFGSKACFMAYAARVMRSLVIDEMRARAAQKRGGGIEMTALAVELPQVAELDVESERLGDALDALAAIEPRLAQCVDLKFFCGHSFREIAQLWEVSERTVQRDWDKARLLLNRFMLNPQAPAGRDAQSPHAWSFREDGQ